MKKKKQKSHYELLRRQWLSRHKKARRELLKKHKEAVEWINETVPDKEKLASSAAGLLMMSSSALPATISAVENYIQADSNDTEHVQTVDNTQALVDELKVQNLAKARILTSDEEITISQILSKYFKMDVRAEIDGKRLNRTFGVIGAEQHLMRYPGDTMVSHLPSELTKDKFIYSSGMAPGRGAWGYFAKSKAEMTNTDIERERWYIAVQTFLAPNYNSRLNDYRGFFKYRKMLLVNTQTGQAIVTVIGDAGPAQWTGKHLGGSPEVMHYLGFSGGMRKGPVLYFFIDDPTDTIPLGPVKP